MSQQRKEKSIFIQHRGNVREIKTLVLGEEQSFDIIVEYFNRIAREKIELDLPVDLLYYKNINRESNNLVQVQKIIKALRINFMIFSNFGKTIEGIQKLRESLQEITRDSPGNNDLLNVYQLVIRLLHILENFKDIYTDYELYNKVKKLTLENHEQDMTVEHIIKNPTYYQKLVNQIKSQNDSSDHEADWSESELLDEADWFDESSSDKYSSDKYSSDEIDWESIAEELENSADRTSNQGGFSSRDDTDKRWICPLCTYSNNMLSSHCAMCRKVKQVDLQAVKGKRMRSNTKRMRSNTKRMRKRVSRKRY